MRAAKRNLEKQLGRDKGVILVITAIALPAILAVIGLALDSGRAYGVRAKLYAAVDAAGLAAAKAVAEGEPAAQAAASKFFAANIPSDYIHSNPALGAVTFSYSAAGDITIDVSATATPPTTFLPIIGINQIPVTATAQTIRRTVDLGFVVDNTTSLSAGSIGDVTDAVIERSKQFVENFNGGIDRVALVKYAYGAEVPVELQASRGFDKQAVMDEIDAFEFGGAFVGDPSHLTNSSEGFWRALEQLRNANNPASIRAIVFFNDGAPNTFAATFEFDSDSDHAGSIKSGDSDGPSNPNGMPAGLYEPDSVYEQSGSPWNWSTNPNDWRQYGNRIAGELSGFPEFYNPHDVLEEEFRVINEDHPRRPVSNYSGSNNPDELYTKVNRVARNLVEDMAEQARQEGIFVFTLGLGSALTDPSGPDDERGEDILLRMANDPQMLNTAIAGDFRPEQLQGVYCHAVDEFAIAPCFDQIISTIIRLTN